MSEKNPTEESTPTQVGHTPGPWSVIPGFEEGGADVLAEIIGIDGKTVCHFGTELAYYPSAGSEPSVADLRLIAAAPDLLQALRDMTERYVSTVNSGDCGNWNPEEEDFVIAGRKAVAKAEGR